MNQAEPFKGKSQKPQSVSAKGGSPGGQSQGGQMDPPSSLLTETKSLSSPCLVRFDLCCNPAWRRQWHPTPVLLSGKSHGRRSLVGCSPWGCYESDTTERFHFHFHALEKQMATHSSVLSWRIPETGESVGLPSVGLHGVRHD